MVGFRIPQDSCAQLRDAFAHFAAASISFAPGESSPFAGSYILKPPGGQERN
jgi:hypothetical protein